ncbi:Putative glycoside hydrolase, family 43, concanavalin A-like lectin/glucanase domain superfamily [Colletotrichum destructivum]|uniref:Glycoside hydrolase, family 43, concanavalin A-like lectin/glucanase domain superfamily n=1 Tax=Colletotrichum destructivum TaxID=34406 RepID=A0AAX4ISN0_9PEZI|nr:Putative glycoside hydrolase, family 43, concanavalin A-like lectin/glucanase domain superfamily [Colletotrichum destructivum]
MVLSRAASASWLMALACSSLVFAGRAQDSNSTFYNPIIPGFHPDPSCIFVSEQNDTFFCASSSFNAFPGIPLHASKDLHNWKLIGHVLNRKEQLPRLAETNRSTSGIWAPTLRYHDKAFWVVTTLVDDEKDAADVSRWDNIIFKAKDPYDLKSWSDAVHFEFEGYDTEPFWDDDGKTYLNGAHAWKVGPWIQQTEANLDTGEVGEWKTIWNGTGGMAPEGPHIYRKDGWYYLLAAEGGTGLGHMVTMARSNNIDGPYESNPANPILTNANTTDYFQTVGHADLFQDHSGNWWSVALATRSGPQWLHFPMVRETVLTAATWNQGEWPYLTPVAGKMSGWKMPAENLEVKGPGPWVSLGDVEGDVINFAPNSTVPAHFTHWRYPIESSYAVSPPEHPNSLRLTPSKLNLTALNGNYAGAEGQTFVGRRQQDTLFSYSVDVDFKPTEVEEETGVSVFLTQNHHFDLGVVLLPASASTQAFPGQNLTIVKDPDELKLHLRFRGESYAPIPANIVAPVPEGWVGTPLQLEIKAFNMTHYAFSCGPAGAASRMETLLHASNAALSWGFTGVFLSVYATSNGGPGTTPAYISNWKFTPQGQLRD